MNWETASIKLIPGNTDMPLEPSISKTLLLYRALLEVKYDRILSLTNLSTTKGTQCGKTSKKNKGVFSKRRCEK